MWTTDLKHFSFQIQILQMINSKVVFMRCPKRFVIAHGQYLRKEHNTIMRTMKHKKLHRSKKHQSAIRLAFLYVASIFLYYWIFFFGGEFISTIRLYCQGNAIYQILNVTKSSSNPVKASTTSDSNATSTPLSNYEIPLVHHRIWRDDSIIRLDNNSNIPKNWGRAFRNCVNVHAKRNWTTYLWTDDGIRSFLMRQYPEFLPVYDSYMYDIQRVDAARYFILYHYGGVYTDLDIGCLGDRHYDDLIQSLNSSKAKGALFPLTNPMGFSNDVMFASKNHPFLGQLIDNLPKKNRWFGLPYLTVLYSTGPMFLSLSYSKLSSDERSQVLAMSPEIYSQSGTRYFNHLQGSTWWSIDAKFGQWMLRNWGFIACLAGFALFARRIINNKGCNAELSQTRVNIV